MNLPTDPSIPAPPPESSEPDETICAKCGLSLIPIEETFFVKRPCVTCGRPTFLFDRDPKTSGLRIQNGDEVQVSLSGLAKQLKLKGGGQFSRAGLDVFVRGMFLPDRNIATEAIENLPPLLQAWAAEAEQLLRASPRLAGIDLDSEPGANEAVRILGAQQDVAEFSALVLEYACGAVQHAIASNDAWRAAGAGALASGARALMKFKQEVEDTVWRGHSVETLRMALVTWENNRLNDAEEFWQQTLSSHTFVLSQVFSTPVVALAGKVYVGGKAIDNTGGGLADFLFANELTSRATIVELKTPTSVLLTKAPYRNSTYAPSVELVGAVAQVSAYAASLAEDVLLRVRSKHAYEASRPECIVIIGTAESELTDESRRRSFELYRSELRNVRVVTYDEMFRRVATLLSLFGG